MAISFQKRLVFLWLTLLALTLLGTLVGNFHIVESQLSNRAVNILLVVLAAIKVRLVISWFMEVRVSPVVLRVLFDAWLIGVLLAIVAAI